MADGSDALPTPPPRPVRPRSHSSTPRSASPAPGSPSAATSPGAPPPLPSRSRRVRSMMVSPSSADGMALRAALASPRSDESLNSPSGSPAPLAALPLGSPSTPPDRPRLRPRRRPARASVAVSSADADAALGHIGTDLNRTGSDPNLRSASPGVADHLTDVTRSRSSSDLGIVSRRRSPSSRRASRVLPSIPPQLAIPPPADAGPASEPEPEPAAAPEPEPEPEPEPAPEPQSATVKPVKIVTAEVLDAIVAELPHGSHVFSPEYEHNREVVMSDDGRTVKAASAFVIVREMTGGERGEAGAAGIDYRELFLVYRSFVTPMAMARLLALRIEDPSLPAFSPIMTKTAHVLRYWIGLEFEREFAGNEPLCMVIRDIGERILPGQGVETLGTQLIRQLETLETKMRNEAHIASLSPDEFEAAELAGDQVVLDYAYARVVETKRLLKVAPEPLLAPGDLQHEFNLTYIPALELARQLTLMEHDLLAAIDVREECLGQMWTKKDNAAAAPNVKRLISQFNVISQFVCSSVLARDSIEDRASEVTHFIEVAAACRQLNNFNGVMEILAGLQFSELFRLKLTWDRVHERKMAVFYELKALMSREKNMKAPRAALAACKPPAVPYLGMYLTDLTFIEDGNPDLLTEHGLVNYEKRRMLASVVADVSKYQATKYDLVPIPEIREWLAREPDVPYDENVLYERSLELEPRSVLKEFVARKEAELNSSKKTVKRFVSRLKKSKADRKAGDDSSSDSGDDDNDDDLMYYVATSSGAAARRPDDGDAAAAAPPGPSSGPPTDINVDTVVAFPIGFPPSPDNIVFDSDAPPMKSGAPRIHSATLHQLLRELTSFAKARSEPETLDTFLNTYTQFTTPREILDVLTTLFNWPVPLELADSPALTEAWQAKVLTPTRQRIFIFVNTWKKDCYRDFRTFDGALDALDAFVNNHIAPVFSAGAAQLHRINGPKRTKGRRRASSVAQLTTPLLDDTLPWLRSNGQIVLRVQPDVKLRVHVMAPEELARQLTLVTAIRFSAIAPRELAALGIAGSLIPTTNISAALQHFSHVSNFIATEIVRGLTLQDRIATLEYALELAEKLRDLQNYDSLVAVMRGLACPSVEPQLWANLSVAGLECSEELKALTSGSDSFRALVAEAEALSPPCIPYMGYYFLAVKAQHSVASTTPDGLIAFAKFHAIHASTSVFERFSDSVFRFTAIPFVAEWFASYKVWPQDRRVQIAELRRQKLAQAAASASS